MEMVLISVRAASTTSSLEVPNEEALMWETPFSKGKDISIELRLSRALGDYLIFRKKSEENGKLHLCLLFVNDRLLYLISNS